MVAMTPAEKEAFKEKMRKAREAAKAKREATALTEPVKDPEAESVKKCVISDEGATIAPAPKAAPRTRSKPQAIPQKAEKKKPYAKLVFYDKIDKDVKLRIGDKKRQQVYYSPSESEESDNSEDIAQPKQVVDDRASKLKQMCADFFD